MQAGAYHVGRIRRPYFLFQVFLCHLFCSSWTVPTILGLRALFWLFSELFCQTYVLSNVKLAYYSHHHFTDLTPVDGQWTSA